MYLIYRHRRANFTEAFVHDQVGEGGPIQVQCVRQQAAVNMEIEQNGLQIVDTYVVQGRREAEEADVVAQRLAMEAFGDDIYIAKVVKAVAANRPTVTVKEVNEKGVLPV